MLIRCQYQCFHKYNFLLLGVDRKQITRVCAICFHVDLICPIVHEHILEIRDITFQSPICVSTWFAFYKGVYQSTSVIDLVFLCIVSNDEFERRWHWMTRWASCLPY